MPQVALRSTDVVYSASPIVFSSRGSRPTRALTKETAAPWHMTANLIPFPIDIDA